jgi:serine/threonine protein kinase
LTVLRTLGQGGYAKVYEVFNEDNDLYALKVVDLAESRNQCYKTFLR